MILLIDNFDSFTFNLFHFLGDLGVAVEVRRNDAVSVQDVMAMRPDAVLLSPGPCTPNEAGICLPLIAAAAETRLPLMGVCLGHQAIGQAFGGTVLRAPEPVHGKVWDVTHVGTDIFAGVPSPFRATRYHSLVVEAATLPGCLIPTAHTADGLIMGMAHRDLPIWGVQFHPESIASEHGHAILGNFCRLAGAMSAPTGAA